MDVSPQAGKEDECVLGSGAVQVGRLTLTDPSIAAGKITSAGTQPEARPVVLLGGSVSGYMQPGDVNQNKLVMLGAADGARYTAAKEADQGALPPVAAKVLPADGGSTSVLAGLAGSASRLDVDENGAESKWGRWKRMYKEKQVERAVVHGVCAKHVKFGVPTTPNSGSELSSRKVAYAAILESTGEVSGVVLKIKA